MSAFNILAIALLSLCSLNARADYSPDISKVSYNRSDIVKDDDLTDRSWGIASDDLRVSLALTNTQATIGKPLVCTVVVDNIGTKTKILLDTDPNFDFEFVLTSPTGEKVSSNSNVLDQAEEFKRMRVILPPHEAVVYQLSVATPKLLREPGEYKVRINYILKSDQRKKLPSNEVKLSVTKD